MYAIKVKKEEIDEVMNQCSEAENEGRSNFPGMTYEQGVQAGIRWVVGEEPINPLTN